MAWTFRNFSRNGGSPPALLDIGCGAGRHALFFATEGFKADACDFSAVGVEATRERASKAGLTIGTAVCEADELVYPDNSFDGALVFGTFTYLPYERFVRAVEEVQRVLKPGGKALIVTRTYKDSRVDHAEKIGHCTYRILKMGDGSPSDVEEGMIMTFLNEAEVEKVFSPFKLVLRDRLTVTMSGGQYFDDDWYIHVEK
ncbi:MAG TPA: class I SAM-dependent methyltransferase [Burkholderiales bacterium]|nr:class I SAM-dependent methyltransferase [Burkholderiales bacterium]